MGRPGRRRAPSPTPDGTDADAVPGAVGGRPGRCRHRGRPRRWRTTVAADAAAGPGDRPPTWASRIWGRDLHLGARRRPPPRRLHPLLRRARAHGRAVGQPHPPRPLGAVHHRRHGARSSPSSWATRCRRGPGPRRCRSASARSTSTSSAPPCVTARSSRCSATSASATTSSPTPSPSPGSWSPRSSGIDGDRLWVTVYETDDEAEAIWRDVVGVRPTASSVWVTTTSGRWATPARAVPARRSSSTRAPPTAPTGDRPSAARSGSSRSGTWCSCSTTGGNDGSTEPLPRPSIDTGAGLERILPVHPGRRLALRHRPVPAHAGHRPVDHRAHLRRRRARPTWACGSWPTTAGPCPCWWPTACCPPTKAGATCSAASSAGPCAGPASSA